MTSSRPALPEHRLIGVHNATVIENRDPDDLGRVLVSLAGWQGALKPQPLWARLTTLEAGPEAGTWFVPDIGDEVLVAFMAGDPRQPVVLGSLWNGQRRPPEAVGPDNERRLIRTRAGTTITLDDSEESLQLETPHGVRLTLNDAAGGRLTLDDGSGTTITLGSQGVTVETGATVHLSGATITLSAGAITVDAAIANFSGVVQCSALIATSVAASAYTPGAGNMW